MTTGLLKFHFNESVQQIYEKLFTQDEFLAGKIMNELIITTVKYQRTLLLHWR